MYPSAEINQSVASPHPDEEQTVSLLLSRARVHSTREQWNEAVAACTEALRRCPTSVTACSLLGEIYENQGRWSDAVQWYTMALERDPSREANRIGRDRASYQQTLQIQAVLKANNPPPVKPATERTLEWFDRVFPPGESGSIARLLYIVSGSVTVLMVISGVVFYVFFQRGVRAQTVLPTTTGDVTTVSVAPPTTGVTSVASPDEMTSNAISSSVPFPSPSASSIVTVSTPETTSGLLAQAPGSRRGDEAFRKVLNEALGGTIIVNTLQREPTTGRITLDILALLGETTQKTRDNVVRAAALALKTAAVNDRTLQTGTVRVAVPDLSRTPQPVFAFSGEIVVTRLRSTEVNMMEYIDLIALFTGHTWGQLPN